MSDSPTRTQAKSDEPPCKAWPECGCIEMHRKLCWERDTEIIDVVPNRPPATRTAPWPDLDVPRKGRLWQK